MKELRATGGLGNRLGNGGGGGTAGSGVRKHILFWRAAGFKKRGKQKRKDKISRSMGGVGGSLGAASGGLAINSQQVEDVKNSQGSCPGSTVEKALRSTASRGPRLRKVATQMENMGNETVFSKKTKWGGLDEPHHQACMGARALGKSA